MTATLEHYRRDEALTHIPVWQMISRSLDDITQTAQRWADQVGGTVIDGISTVGGGSLPGATIPTALLAIDTESPDRFMAQLRENESPVIARVSAGQLWVDPRTVLPDQEASLLNTILSIRSQR